MYKLVSCEYFLKKFSLDIQNLGFQFVLAAVLAVANSAVVYSGLPGVGAINYAHAGAYPYHHAGYYGAPLHYAAPAAVAAPAPVAIPAPAPVQYALPPAREIQEAPVVSQTVEPVEQHGYSIRY